MTKVSKILSMNIGGPEELLWNGKSVFTSMRKSPVGGPLVVHRDRIEGNSFANPNVHGSVDAVLYVYGISSANDFAKRIGLAKYVPGSTGETLTVDEFDEKQISVGDVFAIGEVLAQATYPRIPCGKVNFCMQHEQGQKAMQDCGKSGVYFRVLKPGLIHEADQVERVEQAKHAFMISRLYELVIRNQRPTSEELEVAKLNPAFIAKQISRWEAAGSIPT